MRKVFLIILGCTAVLLAGYAGYRSYRVWKQQHFLRLAREYLAKPDIRNATLCLQKVIQANPQNSAAMRLIANITEAERSPSAVLWRARVVELNPHSAEDRLGLAKTALEFREVSLAAKSLAAVDPADQQTAIYQNLAGTVAAAAHDLSSAESHFTQAIRLEPENPAPRLNLAVIQVHATNAATVAEAVNMLQAISKNPTNSSLRCQALRELIGNAAHYKQPADEVALCQRLLAETNAAFSDRLLQVEVLRETRNAQYSLALRSLQQEGAAQPQKLYQLATWEMTKVSPAETVKWLKQLPPKTLTNQPAASLVAECDLMTGDWRDLQTFLERQNWAELEFTRHALVSRALREQGMIEAGKSEWEQALTAAHAEKQRLIKLLGLALQWKWLSESEDLLWKVVNQYPSEKWAFKALETDLYLNGRTRPLFSLYSQASRREPTNLTLENDLAMVALLLEAKEVQPYKLARAVYDSNQTNAAYVSTYAFALILQDKNAEALKVLEQLRPEQLEDPSIAGYYALALQSSGNQAKARQYFKLTAKARLLPEERKVFERAGLGS